MINICSTDCSGAQYYYCDNVTHFKIALESAALFWVYVWAACRNDDGRNVIIKIEIHTKTQNAVQLIKHVKLCDTINMHSQYICNSL